MRMISNALSGASAAQAALNTVSQNLSNQMSAGYSRQGVVLATLSPSVGEPHSAGSGVDVAAIHRYSDEYKNLQLWQAAANRGALDAGQPYFDQLEQVMASSGSSLSQGLDKFYAALGAASVEPTSIPLRQQVISEAGALGQRVNNLAAVLSAQQAALKEQRHASLEQINGLAASVAVLNAKVAAADASGLNSAGLLDERDRQIDRLSALLALQVTQQPDGSKNLTLRSGQPLVAGDSAATLGSQTLSDGSQQLRLRFASEDFALGNAHLGGQLGGINDYQASVLHPLQAALATIAGELAGRVNSQLAAGFDLDGKAGTALFVFDAGAADGMLKAGSLTPAQLAFSSHAGKIANSDNLRALIALQNQQISLPGLGMVTVADAYTQLSGRLAISSQQNKAALGTARVVRVEAEKNWQASSGVNRDEEAIKLVEYQQMYQANMKVIAVANQLFDSTLAIF